MINHLFILSSIEYTRGKISCKTSFQVRGLAPTPAGPAMAGQVFICLRFAHAQYANLLLLVQLRLLYELIADTHRVLGAN